MVILIVQQKNWLTLTEVSMESGLLFIASKPDVKSIHDLPPNTNQIGILLSSLSIRLIIGLLAQLK